MCNADRLRRVLSFYAHPDVLIKAGVTIVLLLYVTLQYSPD